MKLIALNKKAVMKPRIDVIALAVSDLRALAQVSANRQVLL
ncbi:MAG TPA: hypothetical protein VGF95_15225 [Solirubrobacteraceae bacterium]